MHFSQDHIFWECVEVPLACESFPTGIDPPSNHPDFHWKASKREEQYVKWLIILRNYTKRCLSRPKDRLPAISGIAMRVQTIVEDDYIAGMFKMCLPWNLLWHRKGPAHPSKSTNTPRFST
ncbi:uncharacterized protein BDZ99DRAFT_119508 [Mytilinidion resinicola]|uniref:Uncharacterized protein n=1 Tax=Mytilinidion resinicola TaxID=574789 RepID=A0A6A6Z4F6_9PEZI|nr:uncharacterized protein BDZ99DRAFT_119508 [Mytilinidion resinicola]KAF2815619.1 hypothetical protein BDZ99DRAFT_119508 [Mytilinidion resinicola]